MMKCLHLSCACHQLIAIELTQTSAKRLQWRTVTMFVNTMHSVCFTHTQARARARAFNSPLSGTTRVSRYQKGKTNLDFTEARDSEWQWHQLGHMQVCTSLQTNNHASTPPLSFFTGRMPFLPPNQQCQSNERFFLLYFINIKVTCTSTALLSLDTL